MIQKFTRTLPVLLLGALILFILVITANESFFLITFLLLFLSGFFVLASVKTYIKDIKSYRTTKSLWVFLPTLTSALFIITFITINYILVGRDISPVIVKAFYQGNYGNSTLELRQDGTYKFRKSFLNDQDYRGTYQLKDSLLTLDSGIDTNILSRKLIIKEMVTLDSSRSIGELAIYRINDKGQIIDKRQGLKVELYDRTGIYNLQQ